MPDPFIVGLIIGFGLCMLGVVVPLIGTRHWDDIALYKQLKEAREGWDLCLAELRRRDGRLEAAEKQLRHMRAWSRQDMTGLTMAQVTDAFTQMCDDGLAALAGEGTVYPSDAACTRHLGEPWPCPQCAALAGRKP